MSDPEALVVQSSSGPYWVEFAQEPDRWLSGASSDASYVVIDARVAELYPELLAQLPESVGIVPVRAHEYSKTIDCIGDHVQALVEQGIRRGQTLLAIGGGIVQDIVCFIASTLFRGIPWEFLPTTLLAQADSCIGSKSSINVGSFKNLLGTFYPPRRVMVASTFLETLSPEDLRSGVGEILKVHILDGPESFARIDTEYDKLLSDPESLRSYVRRSLEIKKTFVERDEFDRGVRNLLNYGHTFGHAIEAATDFEVPHGIAITMGMEMANFISASLGRIGWSDHERMSRVLRRNAVGFAETEIDIDRFLSAVERDKKRTCEKLSVILLDSELGAEKILLPNDGKFRGLCRDSLETMFRA